MNPAGVDHALACASSSFARGPGRSFRRGTNVSDRGGRGDARALRPRSVSDAAAKFDISGGEENARGRDLFHDKGSDGIAFPERQNVFTLRDLNACRAALGLRVPCGSKDTDIGNRRFRDPG